MAQGFGPSEPERPATAAPAEELVEELESLDEPDSGAGGAAEAAETLEPLDPASAPNPEVPASGGDAVEELESVEAAPEQFPASEEKVPDERLRVLVADGDPQSLRLIASSLPESEFLVSEAASGAEAARAIETSPPQLAIIAAGLEAPSGYDLCRTIRERYTTGDLPVILVSDGRDSAETGMLAGANDVVASSATPAELLARARVHRDLVRTTAIYNRFVPTQLLGFLGYKNISELQLGDQIQREMTVLFVDIRSFTTLSERMTPGENFKFINSYLSRITPLIRRYNGFVDKYIGDAVMAVYPGRPEEALKSATSMVSYLATYNGYRSKSGYRPIGIGIGIHTGNLILGIIGDQDRMSGTVISDAVNLASRIQDVTKLYGANIIISQDTFVRLENPTDFNFRFLGKVKVKGKVQTVSLFEIFDGDEPDQIELKVRTKVDFEAAILFFSKRRFEEAAVKFRGIAERNPADRAASLFLNRAELLLKREKASWLLSD